MIEYLKMWFAKSLSELIFIVIFFTVLFVGGFIFLGLPNRRK